MCDGRTGTRPGRRRAARVARPSPAPGGECPRHCNNAIITNSLPPQHAIVAARHEQIGIGAIPREHVDVAGVRAEHRQHVRLVLAAADARVEQAQTAVDGHRGEHLQQSYSIGIWEHSQPSPAATIARPRRTPCAPRTAARRRPTRRPRPSSTCRRGRARRP